MRAVLLLLLGVLGASALHIVNPPENKEQKKSREAAAEEQAEEDQHEEVDPNADCSLSITYPKQYVSYHTEAPPVIDGDISDAVWAETQPTTMFVSIENGTEVPEHTWVKIRWDKDYIYLAAELEGEKVIATHGKYNDDIIADSALQVFLDPAGSTHYYKVISANAKAATSDVCFNKPPQDGGSENSGRTWGIHGWHSKTNISTKVLDGDVDDPESNPTKWTVEMAIPTANILLYQEHLDVRTPEHNQFWRINFNRIHWDQAYDRNHSEVGLSTLKTGSRNTAWSSMGKNRMDFPERWGILQFSTDPVGTTEPITPPNWNLRFVASEIYRLEKEYKRKHEKFTHEVQKLQGLHPNRRLLNSTCTQAPVVHVHQDGEHKHYMAVVTSLDGQTSAIINQDRELRVVTPAEVERRLKKMKLRKLKGNSTEDEGGHTHKYWMDNGGMV